MPDTFNTNLVDALNKSFLDNETYNKYSEFVEDKKDKSDRYFYIEIEKVQSEVSNELKARHLNNLEYLSKMEGFINEDIKRKIEYIKSLIKVEESESLQDIESQFFGGSSLLLWFLLVTVLFRKGGKNRRGGRNRRGFYR